MNRIRKYNNKWQVLITPTQPYNPSFELIFGGWDDAHLKNYYVLEFDTLGSAQCEAFKYPDIDWKVMVLNFKSAFVDLKDTIRDVLQREKFVVDFEARAMTPEETKQAAFNRVLNYGKRFTLAYHMNDIIHYHIVNPWTKNCLEIADKLIKEPSLRITKKIVTGGTIILVGKTEIGPTYEIAIWPTLISQWAKWADAHPMVAQETKNNAYKSAVDMQNKVDSGDVIR